MNYALFNPGIVTAALFVIGAIVAIGVYKSVVSRLTIDVKAHTKEIHQLKQWGEQELEKAKRERDEFFVRKDLLAELMINVNRRLDAFDALEIGAQLAEIKTLLMALKEQLRDKKRLGE